MLYLKHAFHSNNLTEESKQYTSCCASPASPTYQFHKLSEGLNVSPAYFTSLMNDLLHELPSDIREYIDCIMDDVIIFTSDIKLLKRSLNISCLNWRNMACLFTINKIHTFHSKLYGFIVDQQGLSTHNFTFVVMCESHLYTTYSHYSQGYKVIHKMFYLFSTVPTQALRAYQTYKWHFENVQQS